MSNMKTILDHIEKFDGTGSFEIWHKKFAMIMKIQGIVDPAPYLPFLLVDVPLGIYMELDEKKQGSCEEVLKVLNNSFGMTRRAAYGELVSLRLQDGQTIDEYASQIKRLASKIDDLVKAAFMAGLPFELQMELERGGDQSFDEMIERSRKFLGIKGSLLDGTMAAVSERSPDKESNTSKKEVARRSDKSRQGREPKQVICYKCQRTGHIARYCRAGNGQGSL